MVNNKPTPPAQLRVPRFVRALNDIAERAGFATEVGIGKIWENDEAPYIVSTWRGTRSAFLRLKFLPSFILGKVHGGGVITWPQEPDYRYCVIRGVMEVQRSRLELRLSGGPIPNAIRTDDEVEIVEYADQTAYHGSKDALMAAGICTEKQLPSETQRRRRKGSCQPSGEGRYWSTRRQLDDSFIHWLETEAKCKQRRAEEEKEERQQQCSGPAPTTQSNPRRDVDISSIDEFRSAVKGCVSLSMINGNVVSILNGMERCKSSDGYIYGLTKESRGRIEDAINELLWEFQQAETYRVKYDARTGEEKAVARGLLANAESDKAFQRFISQLPNGRQQS